MIRVGVVDYGAGNIASVMKAIDYAGADPVLVSTPEDVLQSERLLLPGVGASGLAIAKLREKSMDKALDEAVRRKGVPFMGICVGMQLLADDMYEYGHHKGLGWIPGKVVSLRDCTDIGDLSVPHMGWSDVNFGEGADDLGGSLGSNRCFYFAHSYTLVTENKDVVCATVNYGGDLVAGVRSGTVCAFQFHPEKSQRAGDVLMQWFMGWKP